MTESTLSSRTRRSSVSAFSRPVPGSPQVAVLGLSQIVRRRPATICELRRRGDRLRVLLGDRELRMPLAAEPALTRIASAGRVRVGDLAPFLDMGGRLTLVRRLVKEGLLQIVDDAG